MNAKGPLLVVEFKSHLRSAGVKLQKTCKENNLQKGNWTEFMPSIHLGCDKCKKLIDFDSGKRSFVVNRYQITKPLRENFELILKLIL